MYEFITGPLAWVSFGIFFVGMTVKTVLVIRLALKKDKVVFNHFSLGWSLRSIFHWLVPFGSRSMREKPFFTAVTFMFHTCLLVTPVFLLSHNILWDERWDISWWSLSERLADYMTVLFIAAAIVMIFRRLALPEVRIVTSASDYLLLAVVIAPFVTGFVAYHQWLEYKAVLLIHILCGEIMLVVIPFTKLSHMVLFFLTRAHIGSEMGNRRGAATW